jgi:polyisoprenoid-binding protein YceI
MMIMNVIKITISNMVKNKILRYLNVLILLISFYSVSAQKVFQTVPSGNLLVIKGTSNLHDWETKGQQITGEISTTIEQNIIKQIVRVSIKIPVISIKSGKSLMDSKTYEALNNEKFPTITYQSTTVNIPRNNEITSIGQLTVDGVTKSKMLVGTYLIGSDGRISIKGTVKLKMTEFNIKPPTALLGSLKTGDDVEIQFEVSFKNNENITLK